MSSVTSNGHSLGTYVGTRQTDRQNLATWFNIICSRRSPLPKSESHLAFQIQEPIVVLYLHALVITNFLRWWYLQSFFLPKYSSQSKWRRRFLSAAFTTLEYVNRHNCFIAWAVLWFMGSVVYYNFRMLKEYFILWPSLLLYFKSRLSTKHFCNSSGYL